MIIVIIISSLQSILYGLSVYSKYIYFEMYLKKIHTFETHFRTISYDLVMVLSIMFRDYF